MRPALLFVLLVGCSHNNNSSSTTSVAASCPSVAQHLVDLSLADNGTDEAPPDMTGVRETFEQQCRDDQWSAARRECLARAATQEQTLSCDEK